jgi:hypothetical protein
LAGALENLAEDRQRLRRFGDSGREFVKQFEMTRVLEQFQNELQWLVKGETRVPTFPAPLSGAPAPERRSTGVQEVGG